MLGLPLVVMVLVICLVLWLVFSPLAAWLLLHCDPGEGITKELFLVIVLIVGFPFILVMAALAGEEAGDYPDYP